MRTLFTFLLIGLLTGATAQEYFATYHLDYFDKEYEIQISDKTKYSLYINLPSMDTYNDNVGIIVSEKKHEDFLNALKAAKSKYIEWRKTAVDNDVADFRKEMKTSANVKGFFYSIDEWKFDYSVSLSFSFMVSKDGGKIILLVHTGELNSSSNEYIDHKGGVLAFESAEEIQAFIDLISVSAIEEWKKGPKTDDLFDD